MKVLLKKSWVLFTAAIIIENHSAQAQLIKVDEYGRKVQAVLSGVSDSVNSNSYLLTDTIDSQTVKNSTPLFFYPLHNIYITSLFGTRYHPILHKPSMHNGIDLKAAYEPVYAFAGGTVEKAGWNERAGFYIVIRHTDNLETVYAHLSYLYVQVGQQVNGGKLIAFSGNTGLSTAPHLHFGLKYKGGFIDPYFLFNQYLNTY
jgi:murein DD-endopeptidase MepM/ murein hydrolase activator NlpD